MAEQKSYVIGQIVHALLSYSLIVLQKLLNSYESLTEAIPLSCVLYTVSSHTSNANTINKHVVRVPCCAVTLHTLCTKPINLVC